MKSIRTFLEGKIRRTESGEVLSLVDGDPHATFGPCEGVLVGPRGRVAFHELGCVLADGTEVRYEDLARVVASPVIGDERFVDLVHVDGGTKRLVSSPLGGEVVLGALRWIGSTRLRRKLAD
ncbi:hypothetical protein L6R52_05625 [Myxococcota bacterium]|nr:hypothetical protein [Myxococcota bacterium]